MADKNTKVETTEDSDISIIEIQGWLDDLLPFDDDLSMSEGTVDDIIAELKERIRNDQDIKANKLLLEKTKIILSEEKNTEKINELFGLLKTVKIDDAYYSELGMSAYELKNYTVAERAYRLAVDQCDEDYLITSYKNNLAYLIRRKEVENPNNRSKKEVPLLLRDGVAKKDTFSLINMALFWALERSNDEDWNLADKLVSYVSINDVTGALEWWKEAALADEAEGFLVHLLLIRHGKVGNSPLGGIEELFARVKKDYPEIPDRMKSIVTPFEDGDFDELLNFPTID